MASENILAKEVVELSARGQEKVGRDLEAVRKRLVANEQAVSRLGRSFDRLGPAVQRATLIASAAIGGLVRSGLQGTKESERLGAAFKGLSREVASVFAPSVDRVSGIVEGLTNRFRNLDGQQQESIRKFTQQGAAALGAGLALGKLHPVAGVVGGAFAAAVVSSEELQNSLGRLSVSAGPVFRRLSLEVDAWSNGLLRGSNLLDALITKLKSGPGQAPGFIEGALSALRLGPDLPTLLKQKLDEAAGRSGGTPRRDVTPSDSLRKQAERLLGPQQQTGGFERPEDVFKRLQVGALKGEAEKGRERELRALEEILMELRRLSGKPTSLIPGFGAPLVTY